jgi:hypothetical protein
LPFFKKEKTPMYKASEKNKGVALAMPFLYLPNSISQNQKIFKIGK